MLFLEISAVSNIYCIHPLYPSGLGCRSQRCITNLFTVLGLQHYSGIVGEDLCKAFYECKLLVACSFRIKRARIEKCFNLICPGL